MVNLRTLLEMGEYATENMEIWIREHPGEIAVIEGTSNGLQTTFFRTRMAMKDYIKKYDGSFGATFSTENIPYSLEEYRKIQEETSPQAIARRNVERLCN